MKEKVAKLGEVNEGWGVGGGGEGQLTSWSAAGCWVPHRYSTETHSSKW